jgi:hypothetical protein
MPFRRHYFRLITPLRMRHFAIDYCQAITPLRRRHFAADLFTPISPLRHIFLAAFRRDAITLIIFTPY